MEDLDGEIWKPIIYKGVDYTGIYEVSNMGRVKSFKKEAAILNPFDSKGYKKVKLYFSSNITHANVHSLVISCFLRLPIIKKKEVVDHINSIKHDNRLSNLRIISIRENSSREVVNRSGLPCGVSKDNGGLFKAQIKCNNNSTKLYIGTYSDTVIASNAYKSALNEIIKDDDVKTNKIIEAVDNYRISIGLKPIKRRVKI
jgi:hypothetical protein